MVDFGTGTVLYERDPDRKMPIASMVKIMTLLLAFENIESGGLSMGQKITVSESASGMGGSQMFLDTGLEYTVSDLIKGIVICSANDASVAMAETIAGSEDEFVRLMNEKAAALGMKKYLLCKLHGASRAGAVQHGKGCHNNDEKASRI